MVDKKGKVRGLGRGLSALMSDVGSTSTEQRQPADTIPLKSDMNVPIEKIFPIRISRVAVLPKKI